jgi:hypothetical protein
MIQELQNSRIIIIDRRIDGIPEKKAEKRSCRQQDKKVSRTLF